ncbi:PREDICTED: leucine-rich repeat transmembrane neuronal protein 2-like [Priapulus caudatus]|uniref:Leucine-rich repeat transmembrane neuronal protein 2-like n=1 Tax=Priapulus caudatus TaxID=37621 RepID=A0ABM1ECT4_PRICU|nr:PREDICTED: leucine-rich repeat transmembrane neuronal protein 2-like [Priapulus caudatus]
MIGSLPLSFVIESIRPKMSSGRMCIVVLLTSILLTSVAPNQRDSACPPQCSCIAFQVVCDQQCFNQTQMSSVFDNINDHAIEILVTGNVFPNMTEELFWYNKESVRSLDISNNSIQILSSRTFQFLSNLETLHMADNTISMNPISLFRKVPGVKDVSMRSAFQSISNGSYIVPNLTEIFLDVDLNSLRYLDLSGNNLSVNGGFRSLCNARQLKLLKLSNAGLRSLRFNTDCFSQITEIDISLNEIDYLDAEDRSALEAMPKLSMLNISLNPFRCDCIAKGFITWLQNKSLSFNVVDKDRVTCSGVSLYNINVAEIGCNSLLGMSIVNGRLTSWGLLSLSVVVMISVMIIIGIIVKHKTTLARKSYRLLKHLRRNDYRSLGIEEQEFEEDVMIYAV